ncbi:MAG: GNAT family N-acetyltransferase [Trebonia sp.]|jgi:predicted N-acetyltransferase YhbS
MHAPIRFRDLRAEADAGLIEAVYHEILEPSFEPDELETLDSVLDGLMPGGSYEAWGLCAVDGEKAVGCIVGYPYRRSGVLLIGYVAVRSGLRSRGIGGLLLDEARRRWYGKPGISLVVAEIDDPRYHPPTGEIDAERRLAFCARHGMQVVIGPYFQPRLKGKGKMRVYGLFLAVLDGSNEATGPGQLVSARQLTEFFLEYFETSGEGSDWPRDEDKEGRWLLDWYRGREMVGLRPIGGYSQSEIPQVPGRPAATSAGTFGSG